MKKTKKALFFTLALIGVSAITASAIPMDEDPVEGGSWSQAWEENVGTFDRIEFRMTTPGDAFEAVKLRSGPSTAYVWTETPAIKAFKIGSTPTSDWAVNEERPIEWTATGPAKQIASPTYLEVEGPSLVADPKKSATWLRYTIVFLGVQQNSFSFEEISWNGNQANQWQTFNWTWDPTANAGKGKGSWSWVTHDLATESVPNLPDSGTTLVLLGGALTGLGALRRKFRS